MTRVQFYSDTNFAYAVEQAQQQLDIDIQYDEVGLTLHIDDSVDEEFITDLARTWSGDIYWG